MPPMQPDFETELPDLADVSLEDLVGLDNPVLLESLGRVLEESDKPQDVVAGFQSAI